MKCSALEVIKVHEKFIVFAYEQLLMFDREDSVLDRLNLISLIIMSVDVSVIICSVEMPLISFVFCSLIVNELEGNVHTILHTVFVD
jgi:hypothetical protein